MGFELTARVITGFMKPKLQSIDHIHIHVTNRDQSEKWYKRVLGLERDSKLEFWAVGGGPLTLVNKERTIHLALI